MALVAFCWSLTLLLDKVALRHASPRFGPGVERRVAAAVVVLLGARGQIAQLTVAPRAWASGVRNLVGRRTLTVQLAAIRHMEVALVRPQARRRREPGGGRTHAREP
jgi:uncharacterized membrane protein